MDIKQVSYKNDNTFDANHLFLQIKGEQINHVIVNTLRRVILEDIPCYAFSKKNINITKNSSVFNNDYMTNRLENIPVLGIDNQLDLDEYENLRQYTRGRTIEVKEELEIENLNLLNMYVGIKNITKDIMNVTSDECEFFINEKRVDSIYNHPILIIKLKPDEEFECSMIIDKNVALNHAQYSAVSICCFEQKEENEYKLKLESRGQLNEFEIVDYACQIINFRLNNLLIKLSNQSFSSDHHGQIILNNEDHTIGNLLSRGLQDHKSIEFASYRLDHLLIRDVTIEYITKNSSIIKIIKNVIEDYIKLFDDIRRKILLIYKNGK